MSICRKHFPRFLQILKNNLWLLTYGKCWCRKALFNPQKAGFSQMTSHIIIIFISVIMLQVMYFTVPAPYVLMLILLVRGATLEGAIEGIKFYLVPDFSKLLEFQVGHHMTYNARTFMWHLNSIMVFPRYLTLCLYVHVYVYCNCSWTCDWSDFELKACDLSNLKINWTANFCISSVPLIYIVSKQSCLLVHYWF